MSLLLKITSKPIEYNIHTEPATLTAKQTPPQRNQTSNPARVNIATKDAEVNMDFTKTYESLGMKSVSKVIAEDGAESIQASNNATAEFVKQGNSLSQIQKGVTIGDYIKNKNLSNVSITGQLSAVEIASPEMSVEPGGVDISVTPAELKNEWNIEKNKMEYVPGKYHMEITQFPEVKIEYVGGLNYVPPSSDPNYKEPETY